MGKEASKASGKRIKKEAKRKWCEDEAARDQLCKKGGQEVPRVIRKKLGPEGHIYQPKC